MQGNSRAILINNPHDICPYLEQTLLSPDSTKEEIQNLCNNAKKYNFRAVCVFPTNIAHSMACLKDTTIKIVTVVGFPFGTNTSKTKCFEAIECIELGAHELDMVMNIGSLKNRDYQFVLTDIMCVVKAANSIPVKVIIETGLLNEEEKIMACKLSRDAGAQYIKTCTGFSEGRATVEDVTLIRKTIGTALKIKASGGVRGFLDAKNLLLAGADCIGTSQGVEIASGKGSLTTGY